MWSSRTSIHTKYWLNRESTFFAIHDRENSSRQSRTDCSKTTKKELVIIDYTSSWSIRCYAMSQVWYVLFDNRRAFSRLDLFIFDLSTIQRTSSQRRQANTNCRSHATQHSFVRREKLKSESYWKCLCERHSRENRCRVDRWDQIECLESAKTCYRIMSINQKFVQRKDNYLNKQKLIAQDVLALVWYHRHWRLRRFCWARRFDKSIIEILSLFCVSLFVRVKAHVLSCAALNAMILNVIDEENLIARINVIFIFFYL